MRRYTTLKSIKRNIKKGDIVLSIVKGKEYKKPDTRIFMHILGYPYSTTWNIK